MTDTAATARAGDGLGGFIIDPIVLLPGTEEATAAMPSADESAEWSRELVDLAARIVVAEAAGDTRDIGEAHLALARHRMGVADPDEVLADLVAARSAYDGVDQRKVTACTAAIAVCALAAGDLERAATEHLLAADGYDWLGEQAQWARSLTDHATVVVQLGEFAMGERALREVVSAGRRTALDPDVLVEARMTLANIRGFTGRQVDAERALLALLDEVTPESLQGATCAESLGALYADSGRPEMARPRFEHAVQVYERLGHRLRALEARAGLGWVLVAVGEHLAGVVMLRAARRGFVEIDRPDRVAGCDYNLANYYVLRGRFDAADEAFEAAATGLSQAGMHHQLANLQWNRVNRLLCEAGADPARAPELWPRALDTAISALIAADYERFQFDDVPRRTQWLRNLGHRMTSTFRYVHRHGSAELLADLIESALNAGVYAVIAEVGVGEDDIVPMDPGPAPRGRVDPGGDDRPAALALGAAVLLSTPVLPLEPPPALIDGSGRELLRDQRAMAALLDPDLADVLTGAPGGAIW